MMVSFHNTKWISRNTNDFCEVYRVSSDIQEFNWSIQTHGLNIARDKCEGLKSRGEEGVSR